MSFTISNDFKNALAAGTVSIKLALLIVRQDGQVFAFTDFQRSVTLPALTVGSITIPSTTYDPRAALVPTNLVQSSDPGKVDNWEVSGPLSGSLTESDIRKGLFRNASYSLIVFDWKDTSRQMLRVRGTVGQISLEGQKVTFKMRSLAQALTQEILLLTSPTSRAKWGDAQVAFFNLNGNTSDGWAARVTASPNSVSSSYSRRIFVVSGTAGFPQARFIGGTAKWNSGANSGYVAEIMDWDRTTGTITLATNAPYDIATSDNVTCQIKCPLTIEDWYAFFGSNRYFAGENGISTAEKASEIQNG